MEYTGQAGVNQNPSRTQWFCKDVTDLPCVEKSLAATWSVRERGESQCCVSGGEQQGGYIKSIQTEFPL